VDTKTKYRTMSIFEDCPKPEFVVCKKASTIKYSIQDFVYELKRDFGKYNPLFDFGKLEAKEKDWFLPVVGVKTIYDGSWSYPKYPDWCSVRKLDEMVEHLKGKGYECKGVWNCTSIDFYDCWLTISRNGLTIQSYWLQF